MDPHNLSFGLADPRGYDLGEIYIIQDCYNEAERLYVRSLENFEKSLGQSTAVWPPAKALWCKSMGTKGHTK